MGKKNKGKDALYMHMPLSFLCHPLLFHWFVEPMGQLAYFNWSSWLFSIYFVSLKFGTLKLILYVSLIRANVRLNVR